MGLCHAWTALSALGNGSVNIQTEVQYEGQGRVCEQIFTVRVSWASQPPFRIQLKFALISESVFASSDNALMLSLQSETLREVQACDMPN